MNIKYISYPGRLSDVQRIFIFSPLAERLESLGLGTYRLKRRLKRHTST